MDKVLITYEVISLQQIVTKQIDCLIRDIDIVVEYLKSEHHKILSVSRI